jgi:hypothetical protein
MTVCEWPVLNKHNKLEVRQKLIVNIDPYIDCLF